MSRRSKEQQVIGETPGERNGGQGVGGQVSDQAAPDDRHYLWLDSDMSKARNYRLEARADRGNRRPHRRRQMTRGSTP
jgi:hypothetical protein